MRTYGGLALITGTAIFEVTSGGQDRSMPPVDAIWAKRPSGLEFVSWQSTGIPRRQWEAACITLHGWVLDGSGGR